MPNPAIELKATGRLPRVTLKDLGNVSLAPEEITSLTRNWCLHPDKPDQEIIEADLSDLTDAFHAAYEADYCAAIQEMHRRVGEATGRGGWPPGKQCHSAIYPHDGYHVTTVYMEWEDFMRNSSINREVTDEEWQRTVVDALVWPTLEKPVTSIEECKRTFIYGGEKVSAFDRPEWAQRAGKQSGQPFNLLDMSTWLTYEATRRAGILFIEQFTGADGDHNIHEKHIPIPGGVAGYAYFPNGSCGDHVTSNIDNLLTYSLVRLTDLRTHEHGHNLRLEHEFAEPQNSHRSIMSYASTPIKFQGYRTGVSPYEFTRDHSWPELTAMYGGEAAKPISDTPTPPDPPDPPTPPTGQASMRGVLERYVDNQPTGEKYIQVPY